MSKPLGVGIIGAGPVTQAIHLPTISTLDDRLRVVHIMDVNAEVGASVARRSDARSSTDVQTLLDDPDITLFGIEEGSIVLRLRPGRQCEHFAIRQCVRSRRTAGRC